MSSFVKSGRAKINPKIPPKNKTPVRCSGIHVDGSRLQSTKAAKKKDIIKPNIIFSAMTVYGFIGGISILIL